MPCSPRFVVRPSVVEGESLRGYLLRLADANGYPGVAWIVRELWGGDKFGALGAPQTAKLERLAGVTAAGAAALGSVSVRRGQVRLAPGVETPQWFVDWRRPKVCPVCLSERAVLRSIWDHAHLLACPYHECEMLAACPGCARPLDWRRKRVDRCCRASAFQDARPRSAAGGALDVARLIARAAGIPAPAPSTATLELVGHLDLTRLGLLVAHLAAVSGVPGVTSASPTPPPDTAIRMAARAGAILRGWPGAFHDVIDGARVPEAASTRTKIEAEFPALYRMVSKHLTGPEFAFLRREFLAHLSSRYPGFQTRRGLVRRAPEADALVPVADAAEESGMSPQQIVAYARRGVFRAVARPLGARQRWLVDIAGLRCFAEAHRKGRWRAAGPADRPAVPLAAAARMLGVGKKMAGDLLSSGLLGEPVVGVQAHPLVRRRGLEELISRFERLGRGAAPCPAPSSSRRAGRGAPPLVALTEYAGKRTGTLPVLVREALRAGAAPAAVDESAVGLARFLFRPDEVRRIADRARRAEGWATKAHVRRLLRCQSIDVDRLVAAGFLQAAPIGGGKGTYRLWRISSASIDGFVADFRTLAALCHASGEHPKRVTARLRDAGVEPVAGPGARIPLIYWASEVERAEIAPSAAHRSPD